MHRLDRDTTGVILIAKDNQVHQKVSRQFEQREVKKEYRALVRGCAGTAVRLHQDTRLCPQTRPGKNDGLLTWRQSS